MNGPYVIVVDDEEDLREPVAAYLSEQGLVVDEAGSGAALDALLARRKPALVVLDVTMPVEDGFSIARRLRGSYGAIGIVMLTARRDVIDRVVGLELGADDYVMKPFEPRELLARIRSVLRRLSAEAPAPPPVIAPGAESDEEGGDQRTLAPPSNGYQREFWIPTARGEIRIPVDSIEWIEAAKDYALLHTADRSHMIRVTMAALEEGLDPAQMMRVHRSAFVRPSAVLHINAVGRHMVLVTRSGASIRVGPRHWDEVSYRLKN
ncbi:LytR/AlgR family response regulator transcription factor [Sphingomonas sp. PB4P5]|uniref:LytR/AlgR family response regulator transcription factor n=1 Tax=Parasphingomonas puruogangriensis TaxID=3096155 RepID=UPI002FC7702D